MEKGVVKTWTPGQEIYYDDLLRRCHTFAERYLAISSRNMLKYDFRTKEAKRALAKLRLQLMTATDDDLRGLAMFNVRLSSIENPLTLDAAFEKWKKCRERVRTKGVKKADLGNG